MTQAVPRLLKGRHNQGPKDTDMSSSGELKTPPRDPTKHPTLAGQTLLGDKPREVTPAPNAETLPVTPTPPGPTVTGPLPPHKPLLLNEKSKPGIPRGQTQVRGQLPKTGWKTTQDTPKRREAHAKAKRWEQRGGTNYGKPHKVRKAEKRSTF